MISYAQNFEDVLLTRAFHGQEAGFYIDVGAMDPINGSVTKWFYDCGWHGINIEPDIRFHRRLVAERTRDVNLDVALGAREGSETMYLFGAQGISTFSVPFREHFARQGLAWTAEPRSISTLAAVCRQYSVTDVQFLKIDAEGWEEPILRGADWDQCRPIVLVIEATLPFSHTPAWQGWEPFLLNRCGYKFVYFDGLNRFYIREESPEMEAAFSFPPNVLDGFQLYSAVTLEQEANTLRVQVETLQRRLADEMSEREALVQQQTTELAAAADQLKSIEERCGLMEERLRESRLWIGQLSQILAAVRR
jgi:FkbM family methyltransferase